MANDTTNAPVSEGFPKAVSDRICKHMNDDHADAVVLYATAYGEVEGVTAATMDAIDSDGMDLTAQVDGTAQPVRISFEKPLADAKEAHVVLVDMLKAARQG
ncbi:MAG: DUF2470 domain-containing protein [Cyanobacteria bacterium P01_H01_bin.130]